MRTLLALLLALVLPSGAVAQGGGIEGDAYLVMKSGDTKKAAGRTIVAVPLTGAFSEARRRVCGFFAPELQYLLGPYADSVSRDIAAARRKNDRIELLSLEGRQRARMIQLNDSAGAMLLASIREHGSGSAGTGMNAHFRFSDLAPGPYALYGEWTIGDNYYQWWAPVMVKAGSMITRDLDNSTEVRSAATLAVAVCQALPP